MQFKDGADLNRDENPKDLPPEVEAVLFAVWRRVVEEGGGAELTLPEAAVLLGTSVESVRRRIREGKIRAFHDERGRLRIQAEIPPQTDDEGKVARLWQELKAAKGQLAQTLSEIEALRREVGLAHFHRREAQKEALRLQNETEALRAELEEARQALEYAQNELASMWRVMSARKEQAQTLVSMTDGNEAFDLAPTQADAEDERARIQDQIARVRGLSRRRRWPWPQAS